ncbi:MAG: gamma carbonic anhydrase family protein [Rhodothermales bacterium]
MIHSFIGRTPVLGERAFVADTATLTGDIVAGDDAGFWFGAVLRGDVNWIRIGDRTNIQDNAVVHVTHHSAPTSIGSGVTVGHGAIVHGCTIEDDVLIGMGSIILDKAVVGHHSIVGAGALVTGGTVIPPRSMVFGNPARIVRQLTDAEVESISHYARNYVRYKNIQLGIDVPPENPFYTPKP